MFIDTVILSGKHSADLIHKYIEAGIITKEAGLRTLGMIQEQDKAAQLKWLHHTLAASTASWLVVAGMVRFSSLTS